ncbi:MAG: dephospho-CoA kinase [Chitinophagaceae bacterium]|nr:dephospho-CoA kinase [Chitinophagaceae bacterium]
MLKVGITGGIGSGKSVVARTLQVLGVPVYFADTAAKRLMETDEALKAAIRVHFGPAAYQGQQLNRTWLAAQVFGQPEKIALLNSLVHPAVIADGQQWMRQQTAPYAVKEAALFFESGSAGEMDLIVGVYAPQALRIQRVMRRDGLSRQEVLSRMQQQLDERMKMKLCDVVLQNDEQEMLLPQVLRLHQMLLQKAAEGL